LQEKASKRFVCRNEAIPLEFIEEICGEEDEEDRLDLVKD